MRICRRCGTPEAEALPDGPCAHEWVDQKSLQEQALDALLHTAYPGQIARMRLMVERGDLNGVEIEIDGHPVRVSASDLAAKLDAELGRRWQKSATGKGGGT